MLFNTRCIHAPKNIDLVEAIKKANNAVPSSRKINGKALAGDVSLNARDVGVQPIDNCAVRRESYTKGEFDGKYQPAWGLCS
ncbi:hypothetical protein [Photorhabdus antumapuensis]|uniref:hypothetical protein n=1 Tax=Photorhabdus antumapuensis TaxID=2862867 RepID=UPI001CED53D1|nr:hypothetical protein [Photorhabdus antumapuensis]